MWVNVDPSVANGFDVATFIRNTNGDLGVAAPLEQFEFGLVFDDVEGTMSMAATVAAGPNTISATDPEVFPLGEWVHVAFTLDGGQIRLYRNGELVDVNDYLDDINPADVPYLSIGAKLTDDGFGPAPDVTLPDFFAGMIDDVAVWRTALSRAEIAAVVAAGEAGNDVTSVMRVIPDQIFIEGPVGDVTLEAATSVLGPWEALSSDGSPVSTSLEGSARYFRLNGSDAEVTIRVEDNEAVISW